MYFQKETKETDHTLYFTLHMKKTLRTYYIVYTSNHFRDDKTMQAINSLVNLFNQVTICSNKTGVYPLRY